MRLDPKLNIVRVLQVLGVNRLFKLRDERDISFSYWLSALSSWNQYGKRRCGAKLNTNCMLSLFVRCLDFGVLRSGIAGLAGRKLRGLERVR